MAETRDCAAPEPRVGTLTIVPSGDRGASFNLVIVAGVGVSAASCSAGAFRNCIVARRRAGFRPHKSLSLPVLLSDRCIGVPCSIDETCDLGQCRPTSECGDLGCPRELLAHATPASDASPDATGALDAPADAPLPDLGPCGPTTETVIDGQAIAGHLAIDGADFVYVNAPNGGTPSIRRVRRRGGPASVFRAIPSLRSVASSPAGLAWLVEVGGGADVVRLTGTGQMTTSMPSYANGTVAFSGQSVVGFVWKANGTDARAFASSAQPIVHSGALPGPVPEVAVDEDGDWYGVTGDLSLMHYRLASGSTALVDFISGRSPKSDIALRDRTVYVVLQNTSPGVHRIAGAAVNYAYSAPAWIANTMPRSLATDEAWLYFLDGTKLFRVPQSVTPPATLTELATVPAAADRLQVDGESVYWVEENGSRIMRHGK